MTCAEPGGEYNARTDSYRFTTPQEWYQNWEQRFNEIEQKIPEKAVKSTAQEYQRKAAKNYADNIKTNYNSKKDYYLNQPGFGPYTFMLYQENRLNYLGRTYLTFQWATYKCGSGPYTSYYCGRLDTGDSQGDNGQGSNGQDSNGQGSNGGAASP